MTLADWEIRRAIERGRLHLDPCPNLDIALQPASVELHLDRHFQMLTPAQFTSDLYIDPAEPVDKLFAPITVDDGMGLLLGPGQCALAATYERVTLADDLVARFEGKSSIGRLFLLTHVTAGFIDPGFSGQITLELVNLTALPMRLHPGMAIGQLAVERLSSPAERPYGSTGPGSHYQGQHGPTVSRAHERFRAGLPAERTTT